MYGIVCAPPSTSDPITGTPKACGRCRARRPPRRDREHGGAGRQPRHGAPAVLGRLLELALLVPEGAVQGRVHIVEALAGRLGALAVLGAYDLVERSLIVTGVVAGTGLLVTVLPDAHVLHGRADGTLAGRVLGERGRLAEQSAVAVAEPLHLRAVGDVELVLRLALHLGGLRAPVHQREVLVAPRLQRADAGVVQHVQGPHAVVVRVVESRAGDGVTHHEPEQDDGGGGGRREQPVVEHPVGAAVVAALRPGEGGEREDAERHGEPGVRLGVAVVGGQAGVLRLVELLGGREHLRLHRGVGVAQIGAAERQALAVVRAGALDQARVLGQELVQLADGRGRGGVRARGDAAVASFCAARTMSRSYRWRTAAGSWPPARKPLDAAVLASARER